MKGRLPTEGLLTAEELQEIAGCSMQALNKDLRDADVPHRHFFAKRWFDMSDILDAFPKLAPSARGKPKRGGYRGKRKGGES